MTLRFGTDGVRGVALSELTTDYAGRLGAAVVVVMGPGPWLVGRDTRESGPELVAALSAGITAAGGSVIDAGMLPTPALAHLSQVRGLPAAMVTASHNPWHDNGVKVFAAGGTKLPDATERAIERAVHDAGAATGAATTETFDATDDYVRHLVQGNARLDGLSIVLDCANGAMSHVAPAAFTALGAVVRVIHAAPDGRNINEQCGATHIASLAAEVTAAGADLGLAFDGDGDRVIAVDHLGNVVDGDRLIALAALHLKEQQRLRHNTVVVTVMSNLGFHRAMQAAGIEVVTTAVGDRYVLEELERGGYSLGGEQSGHIIYRELATTGDGLLAALRLAAFVHGHHSPLAMLAGDVMETYPQVLVNVRVADRHPHAAAELADEIAAAEQSLGDEGRVLVRASGTEPLIRVMVEAPTAATAQSIADELAGHVQRRFG